jgi:hypothetical protein
VKWTETFLLSATCILELNIIGDDLINRAVVANVRNIFIPDTTGHVGNPIGFFGSKL